MVTTDGSCDYRYALYINKRLYKNARKVVFRKIEKPFVLVSLARPKNVNKREMGEAWKYIIINLSNIELFIFF